MKQTVRQRAALRGIRRRKAEAAADQAAEELRTAPHGMVRKLRAKAVKARARALKLGEAAR